jgi:hypothetical protein
MWRVGGEGENWWADFLLVGACHNYFFVFCVFFTYFGKKSRSRVPDLASQDIYMASFCHFVPDLDWLASQPIQI